MRKFVDDEKAYLDWIQNNPNGYVVNTNRKPNKKYLMLHKAVCSSISTSFGNYTTHEYIKFCSLNLEKLENWAYNEVKGELTPCGMCFRSKKVKIKAKKKNVGSKLKAKLTALKCPSCNAILKERPPCKCEYCGAMIELMR